QEFDASVFPWCNEVDDAVCVAPVDVYRMIDVRCEESCGDGQRAAVSCQVRSRAATSLRREWLEKGEPREARCFGFFSKGCRREESLPDGPPARPAAMAHEG